ncbi:hypothetical protein FIBSPDRAFT_882070 [Athelia psychrophila]|uniref:CxC1-like cysteine cluster associated with KDZ transposases domain-containing protein n=1 Tax=Athelia psychrophila TaxID=1759441 RepID=A0A166W348_9AGAM|nr:hypothetical protein FIBSPDRAFT_882070 [Fibularhizoctonia sp. CBS 109695]
MASRDRKRQPVTGGYGQHYVSPKKARNSSSKRTKIYLGDPAQREQLRSKLANIFSPSKTTETTVPIDDADPDWMNVDNDTVEVAEDAEDAGYHLYDKWKKIVPGLVDKYLRYMNATIGKPVGPGCPSEIPRSDCTCGHERAKMSRLTCLYYDHFRAVKVHSCYCQPIAQQLVKHGLFPSAPEQPQIAVALELLGLYHTLFERSCNAVNALAESLHSHYTRRGFHTVNEQGDYIVNPWRRPLGAAIQWHDTLQVEVQTALEVAAAAISVASRAQAAKWVDELSATERAAKSRTHAADSHLYYIPHEFLVRPVVRNAR